MRVLYAIQGTRNEHLSRALEIVPILQRKCRLDILVSGRQADLVLPFEVKYRFPGLPFVLGKKGGIDFVKTFSQLETEAFHTQIRQLPVEEYDLVISDFEPISAWACYYKAKPCVSLSHQTALIAPSATQPVKEDRLGKLTLENYAPATLHYGFHFQRYSPSTFTPVIRSQVRSQLPTDKGHYTVYLPAYSDELLLRKLSYFKDVKWEVFSRNCQSPFLEGNVAYKPIDREMFAQSMASSAGVLCEAGFETPAEALYLQKKLLVVAMKGHYEQRCNAAALSEMGVTVIGSLKKKNLPVVTEWLWKGQTLTVDYPDETEQILDSILASHGLRKQVKLARPTYLQKWQSTIGLSLRFFFA